MNAQIHASSDVEPSGGGANPPCTELIPDALPKVENSAQSENSDTGVSTRYMPLPKEITASRGAAHQPHWYALRATYGREKKAYDYLVENHVEAYYPTIKTVKEVDGKQQTIEESRLPNIFFARGTEEELKSFVYDNVNLPYLRFYYRHFRKGTKIVYEPVIVPDYQMEGLKIICSSGAQDILVLPTTVQKFQKGQKVRVTDGAFAGLEGKVARYYGQQRVAVIIDGLLTACTTYVPSAFMDVL